MPPGAPPPAGWLGGGGPAGGGGPRARGRRPFISRLPGAGGGGAWGAEHRWGGWSLRRSGRHLMPTVATAAAGLLVAGGPLGECALSSGRRGRGRLLVGGGHGVLLGCPVGCFVAGSRLPDVPALLFRSSVVLGVPTILGVGHPLPPRSGTFAPLVPLIDKCAVGGARRSLGGPGVPRCEGKARGPVVSQRGGPEAWRQLTVARSPIAPRDFGDPLTRSQLVRIDFVDIVLVPHIGSKARDGEAQAAPARRLDQPAVDELLTRSAQRLGCDVELLGQVSARDRAVTEASHGHQEPTLLGRGLGQSALEQGRHPPLGLLGALAHVPDPDLVALDGTSHLPDRVADQLNAMRVPGREVERGHDRIV